MSVSPPSHGSEAGHKAEVQDPAWQHPHPMPRRLVHGSSNPGDPATQAASHQGQPQSSDTGQHEASFLKTMMALGICHPGMGHQAGKTQPACRPLLLAHDPGPPPAPGIWAGDSWLSEPQAGGAEPHMALGH